MTSSEAALRSALEKLVRAEKTLPWPPDRGALEDAEKALAAPPHGKDAGEEPETAALKPESEWDVPYVLRLAEQRDALQAENAILRRGLKGDYDLDAWLEWCHSKAGVEARLTEAEEFLWTLVDDPDWSNTSREAVVAFLKPPEGTP